MLYDRLAGLDLEIESYSLERRERETSSGFTRTTTVITLRGEGHAGRGEDVTYDREPHDALLESEDPIPITGSYALAGAAERLSALDLFPGEGPDQSIFRNYRRWAVESAALDLALKQAGTDLASYLGRSYAPVRFVVSTRLGEPPTGERVRRWLDRDDSLEFKLDATDEWTADLVERLAATGAVRIVDLKGNYEGTDVDQAPDPDLYERVLAGFPDAIVEDPAVTAETRPVLADAEHRLSWDYPIRGLESVESLPFEPRWLNVKPSRFGSIESLLDTIEYCQKRDVRLYGGGQFELDVGRQHLHALASLFYPDAPNDVAPRGYNDPEPPESLPSSPLSPPADPSGLEWR